MFNDEVWALMQHPVSARILVEMARTFRKLRTSAIFISQQGTDYAGPAGQAIKANTSVAYFLQQDTGEIEMLRTLFDLTPAEVDLIKTVSRRPQWSEAYVRLPEQKGGVIRLIPIRTCGTWPRKTRWSWQRVRLHSTLRMAISILHSVS